TLWLACVVNVVLALAAWRLSTNVLWMAEGGSSRRDRKRHKREGEESPGSGSEVLPPRWIYTTAFLLGCLFFIMELVWYRMLTPLLEGTTYSFRLILATALAGIGVGGALYPLLYRTQGPHTWHFA